MRRGIVVALCAVVSAAAACRTRATGREPAAEPADEAADEVPDETPSHPLDALTAGEIRGAVAILREAAKVDDDSRFPEFTLEEPPKAAVLAWKSGDPLPRRARVVVLDRKEEGTASYESVVDLVGRRVESWQKIAHGQPMILIEEYGMAGDAVRADKRWIDAMARRGITDTSKESVYIDVWAPGEMEHPGARHARIARALAFHRNGGRNPYGPPIEGVVAVVDLTDGKVLDVADHGVKPLPKARTDFYDPSVTGPDRPALPPLETTIEEGPGFRTVGEILREVRWENWRIRVSFTQREGIVLHQVGWKQGDRVRPIAYRASLSEMMVPYADPSEAWSWRSAFDEGEYGLGRLAAELSPGENVPSHATIFDAVVAGDTGEPEVKGTAAAVWERDAGFLWSHYDGDGEGTAARRAREMVIGFISTIGNYDYACNWVFSQDGVMSFEATLTGALLMKAVNSKSCAVCDENPSDAASAAEQRTGTLIAENVLAPNHQHFVNVRLDLDVDGPENQVKEIEVHGEPAGPSNPRGNAFAAKRTYLKTERSARRDADPAAHRCWEVVNPNSRNAVGHPAGYMLMPGVTSRMYLRPETGLYKTGAFAQHAFHATRYRDGELYAAGRYTGQNQTPGGLAAWCDDDESLNGDVVVWYTIGVTHVPRPEEFPIMSATRAGFHIQPSGFFDRNPGMDVPAAPR